MNLNGFFKEDAKLVMEIEEVLVASTQSLLTIDSILENNSFLTLLFSTIASIIKSESLKDSKLSTIVILFKIDFFLAMFHFPFSISLNKTFSNFFIVCSLTDLF